MSPTPPPPPTAGEATTYEDPAHPGPSSPTAGAARPTSPDACAPIDVSASGAGALEPTTACAALAAAAKGRAAHTVALRACTGETYTWAQYKEEVDGAAAACVALGLQAHGRVNLIGFQSPRYFFAAMGAICAGGCAAGVYATSNPPACRHIAEHSAATILFAEGAKQLEKYAGFAAELGPNLKAIVVYGEEGAGIEASPPEWASARGSPKLLSWEGFLRAASPTAAEAAATRAAEVKPGHCAALVYTSGTTGPPKAVMVSHDSVTWTAFSLMQQQEAIARHRGGHRMVSYLPLSHIAAMVIDLFGPIMLASGAFGDTGGCTIAFARPDALKGSLRDTLLECRPTIFFGVPRVWEKFQEGALRVSATRPPWQKRIIAWFKSQAVQSWRARQAGSTSPPPPCWKLWLAKAALRNLHAAFGLDKCLVAITGAAPASPALFEYWGSLGIDLMEVYGMSEATGPVSVTMGTLFRVGSVGHPIPGSRVKIEHVPGRDPPGEGEVCFAGRNVMMAYMHQPDKTAETIDANGYLHSGDVGTIDPSTGLISITGRIKELVVTAGGENIAPVPIEARIKDALGAAVSHVVLIGDHRKYNTCLVTLPQRHEPGEGDEGEAPGDAELARGPARAVDPSATTVGQAAASPLWRDFVAGGLKAANAEAVSNAAKVQKFVIVYPEFSVAGGTLTDTLKLKRAAISKAHAADIDAMYAS